MVTYLLKKSYQLKNLEEIEFQDLWGDHGIFTTMWIFGKPGKILFFKNHLNNLIKSLEDYKITKKSLRADILAIIKKNLSKKKRYNHLLRIALNKKIISISLRKRIKPKLNFNLKLVELKREKPEYKNLKYKIILKYLSKINTSKNDIALCVNKKVLETGTSNLIFVSKNLIYSPVSKFYKGNNFKFYEKKFKIKKRNILIKELIKYDEIILLGSGKGVVSVKSIEEINWKRRSQKIYKKLLHTFQSEVKKQKYLYN